MPNKVILQGIATLKEALSKTKVPNMAGFSVAAIKNSWLPNQDYRKKQELSAFNEWFNLAQSLGLVKASICDKGVQYVITAQDEWVEFSEIVDT
ncbi:hypothetical protein NIES2107_10280 [Nostoc carneum NIES-2107]|nr:hypothetical protein NIES2107_10280 [Nostoc carneum NIES-2107]